MQTGQEVSFGPYRLGGPQGPLLYRSQSVTLPPKALAMLWYLVSHAGQVVSKDELLATVWGDTVVSESVLTVCLGTLRKALREQARTPRYIETVHRIGYRFIAEVQRPGSSIQGHEEEKQKSKGKNQKVKIENIAPHIQRLAPVVVGRDAELTQLHNLFVKALTGERQLVFVTGEAGIGKTALIETFRQRLEARGWRLALSLPASSLQPPASLVSFAHGQCIEHYGTGEAYLPVLEALGRLCRQSDGAHVLSVLRRSAPSWLLQLPTLLTAAEHSALQQHVAGVTRERMLREMVEALEVLSAERPLVLVLEDVQWSDASTIDLLSMLVRRREAARLLVLATSRQAELVVTEHPLRTLKQELVTRGQATELLLGGLQAAAVQQYVEQRFAEPGDEEELGTLVYERTEGHPLFMVQLSDYLEQRGELDGWTATQEVVRSDIPQQLRGLIEVQVARLTPDEQRVLEAGSVVGADFATASVAAALEKPVEEIEALCEQLSQRGQFLVERDVSRWPDGTLSGRYGFRHALYEEVVYQRLSASRRTRLHQRIGEREEVGYGAHVNEFAAELAMHFERGQDFQRAVHYLQLAGENAARRHAPLEVIGLLTQGLAVLSHLPDTPERVQRELTLHLHLGPALMATQGQAAPVVEQTYGRAQELCLHLGATSQLIPTLKGLFWSALSRGALSRARELGEELYRLVQHTDDPLAILEAREALGMVCCVLGEYTAAWTHLDQGIGLIDAAVQRALAFRYDVTPEVQCLAIAVPVLWFLGFPEQARQRSQEALTLATTLSHASSLAQARHYAALLYYRRRDLEAVQAQADELLALATAQGLPLFVGFGTCWQGWARTFLGEGEAGLAQMHQGLATILATGQTVSRPLVLLLLAEATAHTGQVAVAQALLADALVACETSGRGDLRAELYRLQGEFLLCQAAPDTAQAAVCFQQALALARRQQAKAWELRAATSLARLWQQQGKSDAAQALLTPVYDWFTEGFDTKDLREVKTLIEELGGTVKGGKGEGNEMKRGD